MSPRRVPAPPPPTIEELYHLSVDIDGDDPDGRFARRRALAVVVDVSLRLSCGCRHRPTGPVPVLEVVRVGSARICDRCDDHAIVTRVTTRIVSPLPSENTMSLVPGLANRRSDEP